MRVCFRLLALLGGLLSGCAGGFFPNQDGVPRQFQPRQIIVTLSESLRDQWPAIDRDLQSRHGLERVGEFPLTSIQVDCLVYRVPEFLAVDQVIRELGTDPRIQLVQANQVFEGLRAGEADPYGALEYGPKLIGADRAHRISTGRNVSIAVIDTGADLDHLDLEGRIVKTQNFVEGGEASFAEDRHGTAVAGVIAARADNGIGIYGIAPEVNLIALKACWYADPGRARAACASWTLAKALDFAINAGSRVINLSLSGPPDELLKALIETAHGRGIIVVAAAAEDKAQPGFPAMLGEVIAVVSVDADGRVAKHPWSTPIRTLAAPGVEILTTAPGQGYDFLSGSSLAAAHVSGVIALLLQRQVDLRPDQVREILWRTRRQAGTDGETTGIVDACRALATLVQGLECR